MRYVTLPLHCDRCSHELCIPYPDRMRTYFRYVIPSICQSCIDEFLTRQDDNIYHGEKYERQIGPSILFWELCKYFDQLEELNNLRSYVSSYCTEDERLPIDGSY